MATVSKKRARSRAESDCIGVHNDDGSVSIIYAEDYKGKKTQSEKD